MDVLMANLPLFIPLIIAEVILAVTALIQVLRHPHSRVGTKIMWALIVLFIQVIGPIAYFILGRGEEK